MAQIFELRTFQDIQDAVREELGVDANDTTLINRIKRDINIVYQDEVLPYGNWWWSRASIDISQNAFINTGTVNVTQGDKTITFSTAPAASQRGAQIRIDGFNDIYTIASHTAGATTAELETRYIDSTATGKNYKLWRRAVALPPDCKETFEIRHDYFGVPLEGLGLQEFRRLEMTSPFREGRPSSYSTTDFEDPDPYESVTSLPAITTRQSSGLVRTIIFDSSLRTDTTDEDTRVLDVGEKIRVTASGNDLYDGESVVSSVTTTTTTDDTITFTMTQRLNETATADATMTIEQATVEGVWEKHRNLLIYPSIFDRKTVLHIDYIKSASPLVNAADEPIMPIEDRIVLVYGALSRTWVKIRDPETATGNFNLFQNKLARMKGKMEDSRDNAILNPSKRYLGIKRLRLRQPRFGTRSFFAFGAAGGSGGTDTITGTANTAAIFNASGELQGSSDVSTTELNQLDGILSDAVGISDTQTLTNKTIDSASNTITIDADEASVTNIVNANIKAAAAIARDKIADGTADHVVINDGSGTLSSEATLAITRGGTGAATATAAFDALSPTTTTGDIIVDNGTNDVRLAVGSDEQVLLADSAQTEGIKWGSVGESDQTILAVQVFS